MNKKNHYLTGIILTIFVWVAFTLSMDIARPVRAASAEPSIMDFSRNERNLVAFSPDGDILANVDADGLITLWNVTSGLAPINLQNQSANLVTGIAFRSDGKILAGVGKDSIKLWDIGSGQEQLSIPLVNPNSAIVQVALSSDGERLAGVTLENEILLWNLKTGLSKSIKAEQDVTVDQLTFSPDGKFLASAYNGQNSHIKLWDAVNGELYADVPADTFVTEFEFSPDSNVLASVGQDGLITLLDLNSGAVKRILDTKAKITEIAFSPDSKTLATGSGGNDPKVMLWNPVTGEMVYEHPAESGAPVSHLFYSPDGELLTSIGTDSLISLLDAPTGELKKLLVGPTGEIIKAAFNSKQPSLAAIGNDGGLFVWDLLTGVVQQVFQIPTALSAPMSDSQALITPNAASSSQVNVPNTAVAAQPDGSSQVAGKDNAGTSKKQRVQNWKGIKELALSQDGMEMGVAAEDGTIRIFNKSGSQRWKVTSHHGRAITGLAFRGKTKEWVSTGVDTEIKTWDDTGKNLKTFYGPEHPTRAVAVSPDGQFIATSGEDTRVFLYDAVAHKLSNIFSGHINFVNDLAFSPDGQVLASAGAEGRTLLWDVKTGKLLKTLLGHSDQVNAVAFSPDGAQLASASADSTVILWNSKSGEQFKTLAGHQGGVRSVAFAPNGKKLISAGEDKLMLVWDPKTGQLIKQLDGQPAVINVLVFDPAGNLHTANENSEVSEVNTDAGTIINTIAVPVTPAVAPQASYSGSISLAVASTIGSLMSSSFIEKPNLDKANQGKGIIGSVFNQLLDWVIPPANAALPSPPGGPILVITSGISGTPSAPDFGNYYDEILRTEGLNEFALANISTVSAATLAAYDIVILAQMPLTQPQADMLSAWVTNGGNLIAMRPNKKLASLLGLTDASATLDNGYLLVDTSVSPGSGIVGQTIQFHGTADRYTLSGATSIAMLYETASTATTNPAVTLKTVGAGKAAAFTYDLAKSISYTHQGNPDWAAQDRDITIPNMVPLIRSDDKFYGDGPASPDPKLGPGPDWIDFTKISIPQGDEQQRLLVNLILEMNRDKKPLPHFWYFPRGFKAALIMTGDDHANNGTEARFNSFIAASPQGCSVENWECVRGTSYMYPSTPLAPSTAVSFDAQGFEVGLHITTGCDNFTTETLKSDYDSQIALFQANFPGLPAPITERHHCAAWSDWVTGAKVEFAHGIRLDTDYYFWPPEWVQNRPGFFTGSGMPMRFADLDGSLIDVYNATSQMTNESGQTYPFTIDSLLDRAVGAEGYYGSFTINYHTDFNGSEQVTDINSIISSAKSKGVPIVTSKQMLTWLDGRNSSSFGSLAWDGSSLSFTITPGTGANGLQAMLPTHSSATGNLVGLTLNGTNVNFTKAVIKGVEYAFFTAAAGAYNATYQAIPLSITTASLTNGALGIPYTAALGAAGGTLPHTWLITSGSLPLGLSLNASTGTIAGTPTATGTAAFTIQVRDSANPAATVTKPLSITIDSPPPLTIWSNTTAPGLVDGGADSPVELGVKFRSDVAGTISGIRFYKASTNTGTHVGNLWSCNNATCSSGTLLATATFIGESGSGWQQVNFSSPVAIIANTVYIASYHADNGHYSADVNYFASTGVDNTPLHALANGVSGGNGVYAYGATSAFPINTFNTSNYWVDVVFNPGPAATLTSIAVTPANPSINVGATQQFTATGTYSDNSTQNLTSQVTWVSATPTLATINAAGLATGVSAGTSSISATLSGISGSTVLTVQAAPLSITTVSLPDGTISSAYGAALAASGGSLPYTWSLATGSILPAGLTLSSTGAISGTPTAAGTTNFTVQVRDSANPAVTVTKALSINITVGTGGCASPPNAIVAENCLSGNPKTEWDVSGAGDSSIQGFATDISVNKGGTVNFKINTPATNYRLDIYRMGYYGGNGARKVATVNPSTTLPQSQPACLTNATGIIDCGNWSVSASWTVPANAISGIYFARAVRSDTGGASHIVFIVRDDASTSRILFQTADTTWQAYNSHPGNLPTSSATSLYTGVGPGTGGSADGRAYKVSYNRPFNTRVSETETWLFSGEYPMVRWLEANGYDVSYFTGVDADRNGSLITNHRIYMTNGHDEYWSGDQRTKVEAARNAGVNLALFSGNAIFWKTRWENSIDGSGTAYRTLVCYKETHSYPNNPDPTNIWTGTWRDPRGTPPADGGRPENALSGTFFRINGPFVDTIKVPAEDGKMRFWRNTDIATQGVGQIAALAAGTLGFEVDVDDDNGFRPAGLFGVSSSPISTSTLYAVDSGFGSTFGAPPIGTTPTNRLTLYRHSNGALVFSTGSYQWSWGLDANHDRSDLGSVTDVRMQQATVNLFADMGVQPGSLQPGLGAATASTDTTPPSSVITVPAAGANVTPGSPVTISGTGTDTGGVVGGVEVSVDGGATWHPATGRSSWSYSWTPSGAGAVTLRSRAVDDSGRLETPGAGVSVTIGSTTALAITTISLPNGTVGQVYSQSLAASGGTLPYTWSLASGTLPAGLSLNAGTGTIAGTPTAVGTADFTVQVRDSANPAATVTKALSITITTTPTNLSIWPSTQVPGLVDGGADSPVELGVKFRSDVAGTITGIRFYKASTNTGMHVGNLWSCGNATCSTGTLLASVTFIGESGSGWQQMSFSSPVSITANTVYVASYHANNGHYSADLNYFASQGFDNAPLHALANGVAGGNGVYVYGTSSAFPTQTFNTSNYWVDVVFSPGLAATLTSIAVTPANPSISVGATQQFTATGTYSDNSTQNLTSQVAWVSATPTVATINAAGLATGVSAGTSSISATLTGISGSTVLTVQPGPLSITSTSLPNGTGGQAYSANLAASGGVTPYNWSIATGSLPLPGGLTLNSSTGAITGTPTTAGTFNFTVQVNDASNPSQTASKALSIIVANAVTNTGFLSPSGNAAVTSSAGDNNGFQTNPTNAFADGDPLLLGGGFAVDTNSGTGTGNSCTATGKDKHDYFTYGINLPVDAAIKGIEVRLDAKVDSIANTPNMCVQLSWDGGTTWTAAKRTATLTTIEATYVLGGAADLWGRTAWNISDLSNTSFRIRIIDVASSTGANARDFSLDWVAVRVSYQ